MHTPAPSRRVSLSPPSGTKNAADTDATQGRDCIGNAKTGSGKTIAFALPILQKLALDPYGIFALVLTPTRELAFQIAEQFAVLGAPLNVRTAVVVGGMDIIAQALELGNRPHVVVATPGRIVDLLKSSSGEWDLSRVKFLVGNACYIRVLAAYPNDRSSMRRIVCSHRPSHPSCRTCSKCCRKSDRRVCSLQR